MSTRSNFFSDRVIGFANNLSQADEAGAVNVMCLHFSKVYDIGLICHTHKQFRVAWPKGSFYRLSIKGGLKLLTFNCQVGMIHQLRFCSDHSCSRCYPMFSLMAQMME